MSGNAVTWVRKRSPARTAAQQAVLVELALAADEQGYGAVRSYREIARRTKLHRNTVLIALRDLEREDRIRRHVGGRDHCEHCRGAGRAAVYDVVIPAGVEVSDGQMNLLADGTTDGTSIGTLMAQPSTSLRHTHCATSGTASVPPIKEKGSTTLTSSALTHVASDVGIEQPAPPGGKVEYTSRRHARQVPCPECSVEAGADCRRVNGEPRVQFHAQRHAAAIAAGAPVVSPAEARSSRSNGTNPRARGTNPRAAHSQVREVQRVLDELHARLQPPTPDDLVVWQSMRDQMRRAVSESLWELWLAPLSFAGRDGDLLVVEAPFDSRAWVEGSFSRLLNATAEVAADSTVGVRVITRPAGGQT